MQDTTFDFGAGPVPAHRHRNPDGSVGGWVASTAYVAPTSTVGAAARVYGTAKVFGNAKVYDDASVYDDARVFGNAKLHGGAQVYGGARVYGGAKVSGNTKESTPDLSQSKTRWSLLPWPALALAAKVVTFGAMKHPDELWRRLTPDDHYDAVMRHLTAWRTGTALDGETGLPHLAHTLVRVAYLLTLTAAPDGTAPEKK